MSGFFKIKWWPRKIKVKIKKEVPVINFDEYYQSPNFSKRKSEIDSIIIHHTAGTFPGCAKWLSMAESKVSAHIVITQDGNTYRLVAEHNRAWHAGRGSFDANKDGIISPAEKFWNDHSIGIELEAVKPYSYSEDQLDALTRLVYYYVYEYHSIKIEQILGHKEIAPDRKIDPANFDMDEFREKINRWKNG